MEHPNDRAIDWTPDTTRPHDVSEPLAAGDWVHTDYATGWDLRRTPPANMGSIRVRVAEPLFPMDRARLVPGDTGGFEARRW